MRKGISLVELSLAIAIVGILVALLLPAITRARESALLHHSMEQMRQIILATNNYAAQHHDQLPPLAGPPHLYDPVFLALLPYLECQPIYDYWHLAPSTSPNVTVPVYVNPLDPSAFDWSIYITLGVPVTSYACNAQVFTGIPSFRTTFRDGTSQTIAYAEHYGWRCGSGKFFYSIAAGHPRNSPFGWRPSFADGGPAVENGLNCDDFYPITRGGTSLAANNVTFQVAPSVDACEPRLPNASSPQGLQVAFADGAVRLMGSGVAPSTFWGAVTPSGGELIDGEW